MNSPLEYHYSLINQLASGSMTLLDVCALPYYKINRNIFA